MVDNLKYPIRFIMNKSYVWWGILGLIMAIGFLIIGLLNSYSKNNKDFYSWILLVLAMAFCGMRLLLNAYKLRIAITDEEIVAKDLSGKTKRIFWKDINCVHLEKSEAAIIISSPSEKIEIPLKMKNWELILSLLEDRVPDDKFSGFDV